MSAIVVACPKCGAEPGAYCKRADRRDYRKNGKIARHVERIITWNAAGRPRHVTEKGA